MTFAMGVREGFPPLRGGSRWSRLFGKPWPIFVLIPAIVIVQGHLLKRIDAGQLRLAGGTDIRETMGVCWVSDFAYNFTREMFTSAYSFINHMERSGPYRLSLAFFFYQHFGNETLSDDDVATIDFLRSEAKMPIAVYVVNNSFIGALSTIRTHWRFPPVIYVRLYAPAVLGTDWILYIDGDVTVLKPFLGELGKLNLPRQGLLFGAVDRVGIAPLTWWFSRKYRKKRETEYARYHWNWSIYMNTGVLLMRNCPDLQREVDLFAKRVVAADPGWQGNQESLHHYFPRDRQVMLPGHFNCQPWLPWWKCPNTTLLLHGHEEPEHLSLRTAFELEVEKWMKLIEESRH